MSASIQSPFKFNIINPLFIFKTWKPNILYTKILEEKLLRKASHSTLIQNSLN